METILLTKYGLQTKTANGEYRNFGDIMEDAVAIYRNLFHWQERDEFLRLLFGEEKYLLKKDFIGWAEDGDKV